MEKAKDSAILARLIYRSYCNTDPPVIDMTVGPFCDSLEFYAKTRIRELIEEGKLELVSESDAAEPAAEEVPPAPEPALPPGFAVFDSATGKLKPQEPADTHTHTQPGPLREKALRPAPSPGKDRAKRKQSSNT